MRCNAGRGERTLRIVVSVGLLTAGYAAGFPAWAMLVIGLASAIVLAAAFGRCVLCGWVGLSPCRPVSPDGDVDRLMEPGAATVRCLRCAGLMAREQDSGLGSVGGAKSSHLWFCIRCGDVADGVVLPYRIDRWGPYPVVERPKEQRRG
jgi:hypothetical protein